MARILIVDDDPALRRALGDRLRHWQHVVDEAQDAAAARAATIAREYDLVLLDLALPDGSGIDVLRNLRALDFGGAVVMLTAHGSIETAVEAIRAGADDFLLKPADFDLLRVVIDRTLGGRRLKAQNRVLRERMDAGDGGLVAASPRLREVLAVAAQAARSRAVILITGESGTGKQMVAEYVHRQSDRAQGPFVYVNCVALADELIESTLFGHEKGAFTGALAKKPGRFESADGGTAFLDEVGDISPSLQTKLLHFLESGEFERVGGTRTLSVDCRVVAATNRDLGEEVRAGRFRGDLFFRLNVIGLHLPPLRERPEDIPALIERFVTHFSHELKRGPLALDPAARARLLAHGWPGNVRELKNAIERMVVLAPGRTLTPDLLPPGVGEAGGAPAAGAAAPDAPAADLDLRAVIERVRREHVLAVLAHAGGNRTRAAALLGLQRTHLSLLLKRYGVTAERGGRTTPDEDEKD